MSGPRASNILSHFTLKPHRTFKLSFCTTRSGVFVRSVRLIASSAFPHICQCIYSVTLSWRPLYSSCTNLLHSLVGWFTLFCLLLFILPYILAVWFFRLIHCYHLPHLSIHALKFFFWLFRMLPAYRIPQFPPSQNPLQTARFVCYPHITALKLLEPEPLHQVQVGRFF